MSHLAGQLVVRWRAGRVAAIAIATAATGLAWILGRLAQVDYIADTPMGTRQITLALTIVATVAAGIAGWVLIALLERYAASPRRVWVALTLMVLVSSIVPIFWTAATLSTQLMLAALHCVAAAVLIPALPSATRRQSAAGNYSKEYPCKS